MLVTQAGVAQERVESLSDAILKMGPDLGQKSSAMADALFYIASASIPASQQLETLKAAAMGAGIGNADLERTTKSLVGVLRSGVGGVKGAADAMSVITAIVGTGAMTLEDFNAAMGTGMPGAAKTFGVSLQSVGAALAYLTDTGMNADMAATRLTMAMALMGAPTQHASKILHAVGMTTDEIKTKFSVVTKMLKEAGLSYSVLATDMKKPNGIVVALSHLKKNMTDAGMSAQLQATLIARAFGGGHMGKAIMQLSAGLPLVTQKFGLIQRVTGNFGDSWKKTMETAAFKSKQYHASVDALKVSVGKGLLPALKAFLDVMNPVLIKLSHWATKHQKLAAIILASLFVFSALAAGFAMLGLAILAFEAVSAPVILIILAVIAAVAALAVAAYYIKKHWGAIKGFFVGLWEDVKRIFREGPAYVKEHWKSLLVTLVAVMLGPLVLIGRLFQKHWRAVLAITRHVFDDLSTYLGTQWNRITGYAVMVWTNFKLWLGTLWASIRNDAVQAWGAFTDYLGGIWREVRNGVIEAFWAMVNWFAGLPGRILGAIGNAASWLWDTGKAIISGLWNGMRDNWPLIVAFLFGIPGLLVLLTVGAIGWLYSHGGDILRGLWNGMKFVWTNVTGWLGTLGSLASGAVVGAGKWLWDEGGKAISGFLGGAKSIWTTVTTWLGELVGGVRTAGRKIGGGLLGGMKAGLSGLASMIATVVKAPLNALISAWNAISFSVKLPGWIPGLGGKELSFQVPQIPHLDRGADILSSGIAMVHRGETVLPVGARGGRGGGQVIFDFRGSTVMSDMEIQRLTDKIGALLATKGLPMSGMQVRRG